MCPVNLMTWLHYCCPGPSFVVGTMALCQGPRASKGPRDPAFFEIWSVDSQENHQNCCQQMSDFKAKMHQIRFRLGLRPRPHWGELTAPPDSLAGFKGAASKEK